MQLKIKWLLASAIFIHFFAQGQNSVGIGTTNPNPNSMLDILTSGDKHAIFTDVSGNGAALSAIVRGTGAAINITKPANSSGQGIYIEHQGNSGPVAQFRRINPDAIGPSIIGYSNSNQSTSLAIYANHEGTGDAAFVARIANTGNPWSAVYGETNGSGPAFFSNQIGVGRGAQIQISNTTNAAIATRSFTNGTGKAGLFTISNTTSGDTAFMAETNGGGGAAIAGVHRGTFGSAGTFQITNASNGAPVLRLETVGNGNALNISSSGTAAAINISKPAGSSGQGIYIDHQGDSGPVAQFRRTNASANGAAIIGYNNSNQATSPAIYANHEGTGDAAFVGRISNAGNPWAAVYGETNGTGPAVYGAQSGTSGSAVFGVQTGTGRAGQFQIGNATNTEAALRGFTNGLGRAGFFTINNASNAAAGIYVETNGTGAAIEAKATALTNGIALKLSEGGAQVSTQTLVSGTTIDKKAVAYQLNGGGPFTINFPLNDGELYFFYNNTAGSISVNGINIAANAGRTCVVLGAVLRAL